MLRKDITKSGTINVTFRLPIARVDALKREARAQAVRRRQDVRYTDLIRESLDSRYPEHEALEPDLF